MEWPTFLRLWLALLVMGLALFVITAVTEAGRVPIADDTARTAAVPHLVAI